MALKQTSKGVTYDEVVYELFCPGCNATYEGTIKDKVEIEDDRRGGTAKEWLCANKSCQRILIIDKTKK